MIFAGNSYGDPESITLIIVTSRPTYITGASSSEVPGASYTGPKTRRGPPESGTHAKQHFSADNFNRGQYYTHCVRLEETNNFRFWIDSIGGLYKKLLAKKETKKKIKEREREKKIIK